MKTRGAVGLAMVFVACGFGQHRGYGSAQVSAPRAAPSSYGTGAPRAAFPASPTATGSAFSITDTGFASRLGSTVGGRGVDGRGYRHFGRPLGVPYFAYPVFVGGYGYDYGYGYGNYPNQEQPNVTIVNPPQQAPQVIINQNFLPEHATPVMREYAEDPSGGVHVYEAPGRAVESQPEGDNFFLLAFKDHSIYSAFAYWVEGDTFHYVTAQRVHNQCSLSLVDRELTDKLNIDRNMKIKLPQ